VESKGDGSGLWRIWQSHLGRKRNASYEKRMSEAAESKNLRVIQPRGSSSGREEQSRDSAYRSRERKETRIARRRGPDFKGSDWGGKERRATSEGFGQFRRVLQIGGGLCDVTSIFTILSCTKKGGVTQENFDGQRRDIL